jgi:hypothetical protein
MGSLEIDVDHTDALLADLGALHHKARQRHLTHWVRTNSGPVVGSVHDELCRRGAWERGLALCMAERTGHVAGVLRALSDPSVGVRRHAASLAAVVVRDPLVLCDALLAADPETTARGVQRVASLRRSDAAARLIGPLLDRRDVSLVRVLLGALPFAEARRVSELLDWREMPWRRLALAHPAETLATVAQKMREQPHRSATGTLWQALRPALVPLARHDPAALLTLLLRYPPLLGAIVLDAVTPLLRHDPAGTTELLLACGPSYRWFQLGYRRRKAIRRLSPALTQSLARGFAEEPTALRALLVCLPPSSRAATFEAACDQAPATLWPRELLAVLPDGVRHREARRLLAKANRSGTLLEQRSLRAWLPLDEVVATLVPAGKPTEREGSRRAFTWGLWVAAVGRERRGLTALLKASRFLKNEQDPVRLGFLGALSKIPIRLVREDHVAALDALVIAVVEARDSSHAARGFVRSLAGRILLAHAGAPRGVLFRFGLRMLERCQAAGVAFSFPLFRHGLRQGAEVAVVHAVWSWLSAEVAREQDRSTLNLAMALGDRARNVVVLRELLMAIATTSKDPSSRANAITALLADPWGRDERVRTFLDHDESVVTLPVVWDHLARRRQDWLDPFLQGRRLRGRFASTKAGWVPAEPTCAERWLPRQQGALAAVYTAVANDTKQGLPARAQAVKTLPKLPVVGVEALQVWLADPSVNLVEAALGGMVWLDEPGPALPVLLEHLDGDRARVAMYAIPRMARLIGAAELETALSGLLSRPRLRVTVHKEVIRLLGAHPLPAAPALLTAQWARPDLHRDVRLALVHAAFARLDHAFAWAVLEESAVHADEEVSGALASQTRWMVPGNHHARVLEVLLRLAQHEASQVREALCVHLRGPGGFGGADPGRCSEVLANLLVREPAGSAVVPSAVAALIVQGSTPGCGAPVAIAVTQLCEAADTEPLVAAHEGEPDMPAARRLRSLVEGICSVIPPQRARFGPLARVVLAALPAADRWFRARAKLRLALHAGGADVRSLVDLAERATCAADQVWLAEMVLATLADRTRPWSIVDVLELEAALPDQAALVKLALVQGAGARHGWSRGVRERLGALRAHPLAGSQAREVMLD